jgi:hypothetical protein
LYGLLTTELAAGLSAETFAAELRGQTATLGAITSVQRVAAGPVQTSPQGTVFAIARYNVTRTRGAASTYDAYFLYEDAGWRLWFTSGP